MSAPATCIVDRIEGTYAVCLPEGAAATVDIPLADLPEGVREGTHLVRDEALGIWRIDDAAREELHARIAEKMTRLFKRVSEQSGR